MFSNPEKWANICLHRSGHSTTFCFLQHLQRENLENIASAFLCKFLFNMSTVFNMLSWYYQTLYQGGSQILLIGFFLLRSGGTANSTKLFGHNDFLGFSIIDFLNLSLIACFCPNNLEKVSYLSPKSR